MTEMPDQWWRLISDYREHGMVPRTFARDEFVELLRGGQCPLCPRTGFKVVAAHIALFHKISASTLRGFARIPQGVSICDPNYSVMVSERSLREGRIPPILTKEEWLTSHSRLLRNAKCTHCGGQMPSWRVRPGKTCSPACAKARTGRPGHRSSCSCILCQRYAAHKAAS